MALTKTKKEETDDLINMDVIFIKSWLEGEKKIEEDEVIDMMRQIYAHNPVKYDQLRGEVANKLNCLKKTLDMECKDHVKPKKEDSKDEIFKEINPWPQPVNLNNLLLEIEDVLRRFMVIDANEKVAVTLWTAASWIFNFFQVFPYLLLTSPTKRCGKTKLLRILSLICNKPLLAACITKSALFRIVEAYQPTLLIDEADTFLKESPELVNVLNAGHDASSGVVLNIPVGDDWVPKRFRVFSPKVISMIGRPRDTIIDRSIVIKLKRRTKNEVIERLTMDKYAEMRVIQRKFARFSNELEVLPRVEIPDDLGSDRAIDNWIPLLSIAKIAGSDWYERALEAAKAIESETEDENLKIELLRDIKAVFDANQLSSKELVHRLRSLEESRWLDIDLNTRKLARYLREFGLKSKILRNGQTVFRGYKISDFCDVFKRYIKEENKNNAPIPF